MAKFYESRSQGHCPKCGREIVEWGDSVIDGDAVVYYFICECGLAGSEMYSLAYASTSGDDASWDDLDTGWDIAISA